MRTIRPSRKCFAPIARKVKNASATVRGIVELANNSEIDAGTDTERAVTPGWVAAGYGGAGIQRGEDGGDGDWDTPLFRPKMLRIWLARG